jgi:hypothetical protein
MPLRRGGVHPIASGWKAELIWRRNLGMVTTAIGQKHSSANHVCFGNVGSVRVNSGSFLLTLILE